MHPPPFLDSLPRFLLFTGKGGVGKTSLACAAAVHLAESGKRVLLTSTDPASNVGQVFGVTIGNAITPVPGVPGLDALEIDPQQAADAYRAAIIDPVRELLPAEEVSAMTEQLSGACTTEIASFNEFTTLLADEAATAVYDHVLFDTAPTGHTVRLLQLPGEWTTYLSDGKGDVSCLGPVAGLDRLRHDYAGALAALTDPARTRLVLVTRPEPGGRTEQLIDQLGIVDKVTFVSGVSDEELVEVMGSAELACVPSLYEGFSLPTAELMACATPLVVSRAGAIPEVVGPDGECADLVTPGDVGELTSALAALLDDPERRTTMGAAGRARVQELFSWRAVAEATAAAYEETIAAFRDENGRTEQEESHRADR